MTEPNPTARSSSEPALRYEWKEASVPPPHHYEFTVEVDAGGAGTIEFLPDYPSPDTPIWRRTFDVDPQTLGRLLDELTALDAPTFVEGEVSVGGTVEEVDIPTAAGLRRLRLEGERGDELRAEIRALVPEEIWAELRSLRQSYAAGASDTLH